VKNDKLLEVFKQKNLVIPLYFIQNYKKFDLSFEEFAFLMYLYNLGNRFLFDPSKFSKELNVDLKKVMTYADTLMDKRLVSVEVSKNEKGFMEELVILDGFYDKLSFVTMDSISNEEKSSSVFEMIEKEFGRTLSPIEFEIIKAWIDNNTGEDLIKEAVKEATFNGVSNLRYIDKILYEWGKLGIKTIEDVEENRKKRNKSSDINSKDVDLDIVDWNWFDEDE